MIKFPCLCGVKFSLPDEMAGGSLQCKACGRLVTVPTLDDLRFLQADGTYDVDLADPKRPPLRGLQAVHRDDSAIESSEVTAAIPLDEYELPPAPAPRYDPFTGELVRAVEVDEVIETEASLAAPRVQPLNKSSFRSAREPIPQHAWLYVFGQLFMAKNIAVVLLMTVLHTIAVCTLFLACTSLGVVSFPIPVILYFGLCGYYSLVVQETGPEDKDDLPTPLRHFEMRSDLWDPFVHFVISVIVCFGPAALVAFNVPPGQTNEILREVLALIGALVFPAVFLTASIDGVIANFRPDRVLGVIAVAKFDYLAVLLGWGAGVILLMNGMFGVFYGLVLLFIGNGSTDFQRPFYYQGAFVSIFVMCVGLYLSYYGCWQLGLIWRKHHSEFPWIAQVYRKAPLAPPVGYTGARIQGARIQGAKIQSIKIQGIKGEDGPAQR